MELKTRIKLLGLKPKDAPQGVAPNQFGKWLRSVLNDEKISPVGMSFVNVVCELTECRSANGAAHPYEAHVTPPFADELDDAIMGARKERVTEIIETRPVPQKALTDKLVDKTPPALPRRVAVTPKVGLNTMDVVMTRKLKAHGGGQHWILYCKEFKYRLSMEDVGLEIRLDEGVFSFEDFIG